VEPVNPFKYAHGANLLLSALKVERSIHYATMPHNASRSTYIDLL